MWILHIDLYALSLCYSYPIIRCINLITFIINIYKNTFLKKKWNVRFLPLKSKRNPISFGPEDGTPPHCKKNTNCYCKDSTQLCVYKLYKTGTKLVLWYILSGYCSLGKSASTGIHSQSRTGWEHRTESHSSAAQKHFILHLQSWWCEHNRKVSFTYGSVRLG